MMLPRLSRCASRYIRLLIWSSCYILLSGTSIGARAAFVVRLGHRMRVQPQRWSSTTRLFAAKKQYDYDLVIIGAGASGLFASGAAVSFGSKTLLLDHADGVVGGDCTNAACVPSKAVRSVARMANTNKNNGTKWLSLAQQHSSNTVFAVRQREEPDGMTERNPNVDLVFVHGCQFLSPHELDLTPRNASSIPWQNVSSSNSSNGSITVSSKKFLIATGASPVVPKHLEEAARSVGVPIHTYRTVLQPDNNDTRSIWNVLQKSSTKNLVIAGGGPTACELGQALARLSGDEVTITLVANELLGEYDVTLRRAAMQILTNDGIKLRLRSRVTSIAESAEDSIKYVELDGGRDFLPVDAILLCLGRSPEMSLSKLNLDAARVRWNPDRGVEVNEASLRSRTASNIYACGDCCDAVVERRAAHAAWTGFHAARNTALPFILRVGSQAIHPTVPAVIYTDPELACVGLSYRDCVSKFGKDGFDCLFVSEEGMDRADMERLERPVIGFVELRAMKISGKVLGMTACGPAAAELANEVGVVISSKLTVRDLARSLHSYPSHGYPQITNHS
jgi:pyruvate/2-oxoglutarate dehydrogenase complex dihydrolipoamide dehydrogenase (E3) component